MSEADSARIVVLLGAPNAGKTSLYNHLTGSRFKTVNYPGATVEYSVGKLRTHPQASASTSQRIDCHAPPTRTALERGSIQVVDTPGIVSIVPRSADERVALSALTRLDRVLGVSHSCPHLLLILLDATQPARHLPVVRHAIASGIPVVVALSMNDLARKLGRELDADLLSRRLGVPVVEVDGRSGQGVTEIVSCLQACLPDHPAEGSFPEDLDAARIQDDFRWADEVAHQALRAREDAANAPATGLLDRVALHPVAGLVVFALVMTGLFWSVFAAAAPFMELTDGLFGSLGSWLGSHLPEGWFRSLLVDGVVAGMGSVMVFVPQIAILFLALGLLEDSGYLSRGAMMVDGLLSKIGLNGKSFVPLLSGAACAIPAAMAARTIPGRRERILTLLVIPLMSCSARLPVWGLLLAFLVPSGSAWIGGLALTGIYLSSLVLASSMAVLGGRILKLEPSHSGFQIELPHWRPPTFRTVVVSAFDRTVSYVKRAGLTILSVSVGFWFLMNFPSQDGSIMMHLGRLVAPVLSPMGLDWKVGVALIAAFAAREVFVSALAVVYSVQGADQSSQGLVAAMRQATFEGTQIPVFTVSSAVGLVVFFLIALQCLTTVAVMRKEVSNRFALGQMAAFVGLAWVLASVVVQGLRWAGVP